MADLRVTWVELTVAGCALAHSTDEADALPRTTSAAYDALDMSGSPVSRATAEFLQEWDEGLTALVGAGHALRTWLMEAAEAYRQVDQQLAPR